MVLHNDFHHGTSIRMPRRNKQLRVTMSEKGRCDDLIGIIKEGLELDQVAGAEEGAIRLRTCGGSDRDCVCEEVASLRTCT